jgi:hypothetical protein
MCDTILVVYTNAREHVNGAVLKCVCAQLRDVMRDNKDIHYLSYELVCYFNISPSAWGIERAILASNDPEFLKGMYDVGWKYNYETMSKASRQCGIEIMKALRSISCHWGVDTLSYLIQNAGVGDRYEKIKFCVEDGYPLTIDHACEICGRSDISLIQLVLSKCIETGVVNRLNAVDIMQLLIRRGTPELADYANLIAHSVQT